MKKRNLGNRKGQRIRQAVGTSMLGVSLVLTSGVTVLAEAAVTDSENVVTEAVVEKAGYTVAIVGWADEYSADIKASQIAPYKTDGDLEKLKEKTKKVKEDEDADVVIVLAHASPKEIAEAVDPDVVDLVCGGHSHKSSTGTVGVGITASATKMKRRNK